MKILATILGAVTAITLLSACSYNPLNHYAYGYGDRSGIYNESYWNAHGCWLYSANTPHCTR